jgi:hypothetical protein
MSNSAAPVLFDFCSELPVWLNLTAAALTVGFIAVCIWLVVRITNRRERWAMWMLATVVSVPLFYVVSFGPACWWFASAWTPTGPYGGISCPGPAAPRIYWPIGRLSMRGPRPIRSAIGWYAKRRSDHVMLPFEPDGIRMG